MMVFAGTPGQVTSLDWSLLLTWEAPRLPSGPPSVAGDSAGFGLRSQHRSRPRYHDDAALPAAGGLWVPLSRRPSAGGVAG